jgi:hypothetical protein
MSNEPRPERPVLLSPRHGLNLLVGLSFATFCVINTLGGVLRYSGADSPASVWDVHLLAFQAAANIVFTAGAALSLTATLTKDPRRSWRFTLAAVATTAGAFTLLFVEASTSPSWVDQLNEGSALWTCCA